MHGFLINKWNVEVEVTPISGSSQNGKNPTCSWKKSQLKAVVAMAMLAKRKRLKGQREVEE